MVLFFYDLKKTFAPSHVFFESKRKLVKPRFQRSKNAFKRMLSKNASQSRGSFQKKEKKRNLIHRKKGAFNGELMIR